LNPEEPEPDREAHPGLEKLGREIGEHCLPIDIDVMARQEGEPVLPDVGTPSQMEVYRASIIEREVASEEGRPCQPQETHPDGYRDHGPDRRDSDFGNSYPLKRIFKDPNPKPELPPIPTEIPKRMNF
jgi:hypothetical protein